MNGGIAGMLLTATLVVFAVGEVVVLWQVYRDAARRRPGGAGWLTQTAWALVPLLLLVLLLLAAAGPRQAAVAPGPALAASGNQP